MGVIDAIKAEYEKFTKIRRDIHAHPELGYEEHRTSELIANYLTQWGIEVHRGLGKTGVVGVLYGDQGAGTHTIGLRADMDALPMQEANRFDHISTIKGKMHGCGHDGHVTMLLAAAKHLSKHKNFAGTVFFIFQPAEEGMGGAKAMMDDGLFETFPCDEIYGMHNWPGRPFGEVGLVSGPAMASSNTFDITIKGTGGHAAMPHNTIDPIVIACELVGALQTLISRRKNPDKMGLLSITQIHSGDAYNVIPGEVKLAGTVRTFSDDVLDDLEKQIRQTVEEFPKVFGGKGYLDFRRNYPTLVNWDEPLNFVGDVAEATFGEENVVRNAPRQGGSEDFAFFLKEVAGAYLWLGAGDGEHREAQYAEMGPCSLHNENYDFNDELIPIGATLWVRLVEGFFKRF